MNPQQQQQNPQPNQNAGAAPPAPGQLREVQLSKRLSFLLRHAPGKYIDLESKLYRGGWLSMEDVLGHLRGVSKDDLLDLIRKSKNPTSNDSKMRYQHLEVNGKDFCRATYGHTFDLSVGADLNSLTVKKPANKSGSASAATEPEETPSKIPPLSQLVADLIADNIADFGPHLVSIPAGPAVTQIFERYKARCHASKTRVTNKVIKLFLTTHIESIDFRGIIVEDSIYRSLATSCVHIRALSLHGCFTSMTDINLQFVVKRCVELKMLELSGCRYLSDKGLAHIGQHSKRLTTLFIRWLPKISIAGVQAVCAGCPALEMVDLSGSWGIPTSTSESEPPLAKLQAIFPSVELTHSNTIDPDDLPTPT